MDRAVKVSPVDIAILCMVMKEFMKSSAAIPTVWFMDTLCVCLYISCVAVLIVSKKYTVKEFGLIGVISVMLLYTTIVTGLSDAMITFLFIVAIKETDIDNIIKKIYICYCTMLIVHIICTISFVWRGDFPMVIYSRGVDRYTLGFSHPNSTGSTFFVIMMLSLWTQKGKKGLLLFWTIVSTIVYLFCKSRTAYIVSLLTLVLVYAIKTRKLLIITAINKLAMIIFPGIAVVIYILIRLYDQNNPIALLADAVINSRIRLGAYALDRVGFTLMGRHIDFYGTLSNPSVKYALGTFTFDCIYSFIFCNMGLAYLVILSILFYKLAKKKMVWVNAAIIIWCLYSVTEVVGLNGFGLFPIFYLALLLNEKHRKRIGVVGSEAFFIRD